MKRIHFLASLVLFSLFFLTACNEDKPCVVGSGTAQDYPLNLGIFHSVEVSGTSDLFLTQDSSLDLVITAEPEIFAVTTRQVSNEVLEVGIKNNTCVESQLGIQVKATAPDFQMIDVSGVSDIFSNGDLDVDNLEIKVSGSANANLTGSITHQIIDASGSVNVRHYMVKSDVVDIFISGSGDIEVYAENELNLHVTGAATVRYKGNPVITQDVSGSLELINTN